jgi:diguanylate cyclase (GGDEF)-like protein
LSSVWYAGAASYIASLRARLQHSNQELEQLATRDALTNVWNRRQLDATLAAELERKTRIGGNLCVCMVDLDHFKSVNDQFGHAAGDRTLVKVTQALQSQLRSIDQLGRFGGEEFLIILPGASLHDAAMCAERLLRRVAGLSILPDPAKKVTISIGLAECQSGESAGEVLARADAALYQAKQDGRNRVVVSPSAAADQ